MRNTSTRFLLTAFVLLLSGWNQALADNAFDGIAFHSNWTQTKSFQLTNGTYQEPAAPNSASLLSIRLTDKIIQGTLNNKPVTIIILSASTGGSGAFYELKILGKDNGGLQEIAGVLLGDRISLQGMSINNSNINITWLGADTNEAMTSKSLLVSKTFALHGKDILEVLSVKKTAATATANAADSITDRLWTWQKSTYNNDTIAQPPANQTYTLQLMTDGSLQAQVDCNRGGGMYTLNGNRITIDITHTTRAFCADSLDQVFLKDVAGINGFLLKDGKLYFELKYDSGNMLFE